MTEFIEKVTRMRELQKKYFKERSSMILSECKKAELEVDRLIKTQQVKNDDQQKLLL